MKKIMMLLTVVIISVGASAQTQQGRSSIGVNLGYGFDTENPMVGIDYRYSITDAFRINPAITHYIKNHYTKAWAVDLNLHYVIPITSQFSFYPLAGVDLSFWDTSIGKEPRVSKSTTRFGANIGLGGEIYATNNLLVGLELKYNIVKSVDQAMAMIRVGYQF